MITPPARSDHDSPYVGIRMTADEFLEIPDDGNFYELLDGVVIVSPSPTPQHQNAAGEVFFQIKSFLRDHPVGEVLFEVDVHLGQGPTGADLVYRPEVVFVRAERIASMGEKIEGAPDLVVEVISRGSRRLDSVTKREDYERFGVLEYLLLDPKRAAILILVNENGRFVEVPSSGDSYHSRAIPGFVLDLKAVRAAFQPW